MNDEVPHKCLGFEIIKLSTINSSLLLNWLRVLFFKEEVSITKVGIENSVKAVFTRFIAFKMAKCFIRKIHSNIHNSVKIDANLCFKVN